MSIEMKAVQIWALCALAGRPGRARLRDGSWVAAAQATAALPVGRLPTKRGCGGPGGHLYKADASRGVAGPGLSGLPGPVTRCARNSASECPACMNS